MADIKVKLDWARIDVDPAATLGTIGPRLKENGLNATRLRRSVYVIRLNGNFCIRYPNGYSPVVYIGEGNFLNRVLTHREWLRELEDLVTGFSFDVRVATPRVRNFDQAYRDCEAFMIDAFATEFGSAPLRNKQYESRLKDHYTYYTEEVHRAIKIGRGRRYQWAFEPLKSSSFFQTFNRTHIDQ